MLERAVEKTLTEAVAKSGGIQRKVQWLGHRGAPDRLIGWPHLGVNCFVELKRPKTPTAEAHQTREHKRLRAIGFRVEVVASKEEALALVAELAR